MPEISRASLFERLDPVALTAIESATGFAKMRGNAYVELVHWIHLLLQDVQGDVLAIADAFGLDQSKLAREVIGTLDLLPRGASAISDFAPQIEESIEKGWLYASLEFAADKVRPGHLIYGMLKTPNLRNALYATSDEWRKVAVARLGEEMMSIVKPGPSAQPDSTDQAATPTNDAKGDVLTRYSVDLTERARKGEIDAVVGRDAEVRQLLDVLLRRRQNNPILVGEAGVGKTAVVEGFARRIVDGDIPPAFQNVRVCALDIALLQAGASVKGEFEKRLGSVIDEVEKAVPPVILFIDEAHTLIGAGGQAGTGDAANLLKPALARGKLRTIAATTHAEYRQYFEKDPALTRRFQVVDIGEPDSAVAIDMLRSTVKTMEDHHAVVVLDEAVVAAVKLSQRYVPARQLPDKAVSLLDTAAARVAVSQHAVPAPVEDRRRKLELLQVEREIIERETTQRFRSDDRLQAIDDAIAEASQEVTAIEEKWSAELEALAGVRKARDALAATGHGEDKQPDETKLNQAVAELARVSGSEPMVFGVVDEDAIGAIVGEWTGIPVGRMVNDEIAGVLGIGERLKERVIGQDDALEAIAKRVQTSRAKLDNPGKPVGVFMLCGPSGVGKTETAHALSEVLFSGEDSMIVINMSEFQEAHTVSTLKGAPAGYVGYGQGGVLTEAVRRRPYSVVLLDEIEKAHPDVHEMFFQVFDKGFMNDAEGRRIDFRNTLILLTSNVGTDLIMALTEDEETAPTAEGLAAALRPELLKVFPPALLGRLLVLPYYPLAADVLAGIVRLQLNRIVRRVSENHDIAMHIDDAVIDHIVARCTEVASGGRMIDAILTNTMLPEMSVALLEHKMRGETVTGVNLSVEDNAFRYRFETRG